ncbi:MAG: hypothetical protein K9I29_06045 [Bacteroidales bacterium]|nr:hypothetical protein [Bacteroidales bacterium]MCF8327839.1 hypothetical protein [Bacteroidales bacterium]
MPIDESLRIELDNVNNDNPFIHVVLSEVSNKFRNLIPAGPPLGQKEVRVYSGRKPQTNSDTSHGHYRIYLTPSGSNYRKFVFQFAHELMHIYIDPRITNWFIESICEMSSLYFLEYLGQKWKGNPPYPNWKSYAREFNNYKTLAIRETKDHYKGSFNSDILYLYDPIISQVNFQEEIEPNDRNRNRVIACKLIQIFRHNETAWHLIPLIGQSNNKEIIPNTFTRNSIPDFGKFVALARELGLGAEAEEIVGLFDV